MKYKAYGLHNFRKIEQVEAVLSESEKRTIEVIGNVLPFKVNNYVLDELIDWSDIPNDPLYQLTFPQDGMLSKNQFDRVKKILFEENLDKDALKLTVNEIRRELNPNPSSQQSNVPVLDDIKLTGIQHKYRETALFFPSNGQTCHAYCTFCFRWPQFVGMDEYKFAMKETELLVKYLEQNPSITDVIFTGGDPMVMSAKIFERYLDPLLEARPGNLRNIRIGTKSLSYWPYKFLTDKDADDVMRLFEKVIESGFHLTIMAHFNHPRELQTEAVRKAIERINNTGAVIRTQSPVMRNINDNPQVWMDMWKEQVKLGCIPYYMFVARDTGAQDYFAVELSKSQRIFTEAYSHVSGISRTVRGPSMSADPGKVHVIGVEEVAGEKVFVLKFIQARDPEWTNRIFFAEYDENACWLDDLKPAFGEESFFFEKKYIEQETLA